MLYRSPRERKNLQQRIKHRLSRGIPLDYPVYYRHRRRPLTELEYGMIAAHRARIQYHLAKAHKSDKSIASIRHSYSFLVKQGYQFTYKYMSKLFPLIGPGI